MNSSKTIKQPQMYRECHTAKFVEFAAAIHDYGTYVG